ncbi:Uncharacterised protein [Vibrio cholerae]|nr:Uncharacterised protein [Vibrio cholerae]
MVVSVWWKVHAKHTVVNWIHKFQKSTLNTAKRTTPVYSTSTLQKFWLVVNLAF